MTNALITEQNWQDFVGPTIDGEQKGHGLVPRDWQSHPLGCYAAESEFPDSMLIPENEWEERLKELRAKRAGLLDLRNASGGKLDSLNQGKYPLCWAFSTTKCVMYLEAIEGQSVEKLSAWWLAGRETGWRSRGGWGSASLDRAVKDGIPTYNAAPSFDKKYDNPEVKANAARRKVQEWWAGSEDRDKRRHQFNTAMLLSLPCIGDWNFWSHSTSVIDLKKIGTSVVDNSWSNSAGDHGLYYIEKNHGVPDGLWIPRVMTAATA